MPKILVVEDSSSMRSFVRTALESGKAELGDVAVVDAAGGFEALRLLPRGPYDLVITDINMPDINGLELVSFLKNHPIYKAIPIMVISTESTAEDRKRASALGAIATILAEYLGYFIHLTPEQVRYVAAAAIVFVALLNYVGVASAAVVMNFTTVAKYGALAALALLAFTARTGSASHLAPAWGSGIPSRLISSPRVPKRCASATGSGWIPGLLGAKRSRVASTRCSRRSSRGVRIAGQRSLG